MQRGRDVAAQLRTRSTGHGVQMQIGSGEARRAGHCNQSPHDEADA